MKLIRHGDAGRERPGVPLEDGSRVDAGALGEDYVSEFMTLLPGDIISTGTPAGVALGMKPSPVYLKPGDVVAPGIDRLGESRQTVVSWA